MSNSLHIHQNETDEDLGLCPNTGRPLECFSLNAKKLICANCLMFGKHKGEEVVSVEDAAKLIRDELDKSIKAGHFKADRCESTLLDIRQTKLQCEEAKHRVVKDVEMAFSELIKTLKERRQLLLKEIDQHFEEQLMSIQEQEEIWSQKQGVATTLLKFGKMDDIQLVKNSEEIFSGLDNLNEPMQYHLTQLLTSMDLHFRIEGKEKSVDLNLEETLRALGSYGKKGEVHNIQYRC